MAKNLKLNIKNAQLAEAFKLNKPKKVAPAPKKEKEIIEEKPAIIEELPVLATPPKLEEAPPPIVEEERAPAIEIPVEEIPPPPPPPPKRPLDTSPKPKVEYRDYKSSRPPYPQNRPPYPPRSPSPYQPRQNSYPPRRPTSGPYTPSSGARPPYSPRPNTPYSSRPPFQRPSGPGGAPYQRYEPRRPPFPPREPPRPMEEQKRSIRKEDDKGAKKGVGFKEYRDIKPLSKKPELERTFDSRDRQGLRDSDDEAWRKRRPSHKTRQSFQEEAIIRPKELKIRLPVSVKDLAAAMKLKASEILAKLFLKGVVLTLNDYLDDETTVQLLGHEFDCEITIDTSEEKRVRITDKTIKQEIQETDSSLVVLRPPVVTFMGHVDHGKTSLIDAIRKSDIASTEAGAITQHIGAFQCQTPVGKITILDTPGHEAFSAMRARGADVTDIVVLVVAGDEGMRTQTLEAITQAREANVPIMVAINKSDKPNFNAETVYRQLADNQLLPEAWGGTTITVNCSAVTNEGIPALLEMLALQAEILELKANPLARARGTVIESQMHKGLGAVATVLVQNGTLHLGDAVVFAQHYARIKTMHDEHNKELEEAGPSTPVKITGLSGFPEAGSEFIVVKDEKEARELSEKRTAGHKHLALQQMRRTGVEGLLEKKAENVGKKILTLILKADVQGSLEALKNSLLKIESKKVELNIISAEVGEISESDVELAAASKATIIGFHTGIESRAEGLCKEKKITVKLHDIIYHAVDDVRALMTTLLDKIAKETIIGTAEVKAVFKSSHLGFIAGCQVTDGVIRRNCHVRVIRDKKKVWEGPIASLKRVKEDVREVQSGHECGILIQNFNDAKVGDVLEAFEVTYLEQEL